LGTGGESTVKLTAEVADGWLPLGFTPARMKAFRPWLDEGLRRAGGGKTLRDLEIQPRAFVVLTDDVRAGLQTLKPRVALYVGGMGHRDKNFHTQAMTANGYGEAAERIQELYLAGRKAEAVAAAPDDFIDEGALVGPKDRIRERFRAWADSGATGLTVATQQDEAIELMADLAGCRRCGRRRERSRGSTGGLGGQSRLDAAFAREERRGLMIAAAARSAAVVFILGWLTV